MFYTFDLFTQNVAYSVIFRIIGIPFLWLDSKNQSVFSASWKLGLYVPYFRVVRAIWESNQLNVDVCKLAIQM